MSIEQQEIFPRITEVEFAEDFSCNVFGIENNEHQGYLLDTYEHHAGGTILRSYCFNNELKCLLTVHEAIALTYSNY